jgi:hypothetical protein
MTGNATFWTTRSSFRNGEARPVMLFHEFHPRMAKILVHFISVHMQGFILWGQLSEKAQTAED